MKTISTCAVMFEYLFNLENEKANREAARIILEKYKAGEIDFGRVFVAQSNLVQAQDTLVANRASIAQALINTYRSLGGGWEIRCENLLTEDNFSSNRIFLTQPIDQSNSGPAAIAPGVKKEIVEKSTLHLACKYRSILWRPRRLAQKSFCAVATAKGKLKMLLS